LEVNTLNIELTSKEQQAKDFMFGLFVPAIHKVLSTANPAAYRQWGGNTCRQSAIFGAKFLETLLPEYDWEVWDGNFSDRLEGRGFVKYNHAWNFGRNNETGRGLLVDLSRVDRERLFLPVKANKYPKNHPEYKNMKLINKVKLPHDWHIENEDEYYTMVRGTEVLNRIQKEIGR
jgi:hypothetical protein